MMQMSRGADFIAPCIENDWPLDSEDPRRREHFGGAKATLSFLSILLIVLICLVLIGCLVIDRKIVRPDGAAF